MSLALSTAPSTVPSAAAAPAPTWTIDAAHTVAGFKVKHLAITSVRGELGPVSGTVVFDPQNLAAATANISIDVAGLSTRNEARDGHLRSADFFDVVNHPAVTFVSTRVAHVSEDGSSFDLVGALTIRGVSKEVTLPVRDFVHGIVDPWGNTKAGASAHLVIDRKDFGLVWNTVLEAGGLLVGDAVTIDLEVELHQSK